ncbi:MAG: hypothetical protein IPO87_07295 [Flavobacteriales bacterium]|nr:hypothetical protein [Flavobacteriales bacterium]
MSTSFGNHLKNLGEVVARFDAKSDASKLRTLQQVAHCRLPATKALINYCDLLLFLPGHAAEQECAAGGPK